LVVARQGRPFNVGQIPAELVAGLRDERLNIDIPDHDRAVLVDRSQSFAVRAEYELRHRDTLGFAQFHALGRSAKPYPYLARVAGLRMIFSIFKIEFIFAANAGSHGFAIRAFLQARGDTCEASVPPGMLL
jgi:hypothetical protein